jgi:hypothetical protein
MLGLAALFVETLLLALSIYVAAAKRALSSGTFRASALR